MRMLTLIALIGLQGAPSLVQRLPQNPIVSPSSSPTIGDNINGPSLIRVPPWVDKPLGRYYLYFSHQGLSHRLLKFSGGSGDILRDVLH